MAATGAAARVVAVRAGAMMAAEVRAAGASVRAAAAAAVTAGAPRVVGSCNH